MSTIIPNTDQIYFPQTRENFNEVFSSYGVGNYRSAVVMLYATTVCDILLKLQELRDTYNDGVAKNILEEIDKSRQGGLGGNGKCKSAWEWELIESVRKQTDFFDNESYITLQHLYDYRNMCAHPAVNDSYELYKPDQEIVIALIKSVLKTILCKPPIYIKGVFDTLTNDLASKKDDFENDKEHLKRYLDNRYYDRMSDGMKLKAAKSLWKICFVVDDDECNRNRLINRRALEILTEEIEKEFIDQIANDKNHYTVNENDGIKLHLLSYLAKYPNVYQPLSEDLKYTIDRFIEKNSIAKSISWFKEGINPEFLNVLDPGVGINSSVLPEMYERFSKNGYKKEVLDFFIKYLGESYNFDTADERFDNAISDYLKEMSYQQLVTLLETINGNSQIYNVTIHRLDRQPKRNAQHKTGRCLSADLKDSCLVWSGSHDFLDLLENILILHGRGPDYCLKCEVVIS